VREYPADADDGGIARENDSIIVTTHIQARRSSSDVEINTQAAAAAKAGISERSARRIEPLESLPSQRPPRQWRTRPDPLAASWETELLPLLRESPHLSAVTLLEELQRRHPWGVRAKCAAYAPTPDTAVARCPRS
jgi:hypothetical protein